MNHSGVASQEKQMEVCEVCGAFLIVGDAQSRVDDHLQGKQHVGYAKIKSTLDDLKVIRIIANIVNSLCIDGSHSKYFYSKLNPLCYGSEFT